MQKYCNIINSKQCWILPITNSIQFQNNVKLVQYKPEYCNNYDITNMSNKKARLWKHVLYVISTNTTAKPPTPALKLNFLVCRTVAETIAKWKQTGKKQSNFCRWVPQSWWKWFWSVSTLFKLVLSSKRKRISSNTVI